MNDVKRFLFPILIAAPALAAGIAIGHYTSPAPTLSVTLERRSGIRSLEHITCLD